MTLMMTGRWQRREEEAEDSDTDNVERGGG